MKFRFKPVVWGSLALALSGSAMAADADKLAKGKAIFLTDAVPACAVCHTLQEAGATGVVGPDLDEMKPTYDQVRAAMRDGVGVMPSFAATLNEEAQDAVAYFVEHVTRN